MNDKHEACIADFGLSRILEASGFTTKSVGGTFRWMAHELLAPEGDSIPQVTAASDVWAFAMTVLEVRSRVFFLFFLFFCRQLIDTSDLDNNRKNSVLPAEARRCRYSLDRERWPAKTRGISRSRHDLVHAGTMLA